MEIIENFDLSEHNTLGLEARARYGASLGSVEDIREALAFARHRALPFRLVGGGSNCVMAPGIDAVVGVMALRGRRIERAGADVFCVVASGGEIWDDLVDWTVGQGLGGLENLAGIPGTVGAAPVKNIGAYGVELSDVLVNVTVFDTVEDDVRVFAQADCGFGYRQSRFKAEPGRYVVLEVALALTRRWQPVLSYAGLDGLSGDVTPSEIRQRVLTVRGSKLPDWRKTGNAGSFFHNPVVSQAQAEALPEVTGYPAPGGKKLSAGWLLEACGLKGYRLGGAGFSEAHALVLVNHGHATYADVRELAALAQARVRQRFGVTLVQEPVDVV